jgi:hypothetical protein
MGVPMLSGPGKDKSWLVNLILPEVGLRSPKWSRN